MRPLWLTAAALCFTSCLWGGGEDRACADDADLALPVDLADFAGGSLWPHGVHGGGHPEGHPGLDFMAADGFPGDIPVFASFSATLMEVQADSANPGSSCIVLDSACMQINICHLVLAAGLKAGSAVTRGQRLGSVGVTAGRKTLHFGLYTGRDALPACPADYLEPDTVRCRLGLEKGSHAPDGCGPASGQETLIDRSNYEEAAAHAFTLTCADGTRKTFAIPGETRLCNPHLSDAQRREMDACLQLPECQGTW